LNSVNATTSTPQGDGGVGERPFLAAFEEKLERTVREDFMLGRREPRILGLAAEGLILAPGAKRLRPRLVLRLGDALHAPPATVLSIATAAELIHSASLLHDDVVDESAERRGRPTANARYGNSTAVLAGDLVLSLAFVQVQQLPHSVTATAVRLVAEMSRAALLEVRARGDRALIASLADPDGARGAEALWRDIAEGKTGSLFGWCGEAVALALGDADTAARLALFGRRFGVAFQLADDLRNLRGDEPGKDRLSDLTNRQPTLPLLRAAARVPAIRALAEDVWRSSDGVARIERLASAIHETGVLGEIVAEIGGLLDDAVGALGELTARPGGASLVSWADLLRASVAP
jgi:geranylgeranyl pyrophosphate synthase